MTAKSCLVSVLATGAAILLALGTARAQDKPQPFKAVGTFVEGCACSAPCACQLTGVEHGCQGVGALALTGGSYGGTDLAGAKIVYATSPGEWVRLYVDARDARQRAAAEAFGRAVYSAFGKIEAVKDAKIDISGKAGSYHLMVNDGKTLDLTTEPILGGDKKTPLTYSNINDPVHPTVMQGRTISGTYSDGDRSFSLKGSNSYFNDRMNGQGSI